MNQQPSLGLSWRLAELAKQDHFSVYICRDLRQYRLLAEELSCFLQHQPQRLWLFPAWETLAYDRVSPHHGIVAQRLSCLSRLLQNPSGKGLLLTVLPAFVHRLPPKETIAKHVWQLKVGDQLDLSALRQQLTIAGMQAVPRVRVTGEFAVRGSILDIWPSTQEQALRIDLFDDEIDSIRHFDVETQRSTANIKHFESVPIREVVLDQDNQQRFIQAFIARFPHKRKHPMLQAAREGRPHPGIESLLPLAYEHCLCLSDYLPAHSHCIADADINELRLQHQQQIRAQFELARLSQEPILAPQELYACETPIHASALKLHEPIHACPSIENMTETHKPLDKLAHIIHEHVDQQWSIAIMAHGPGQQERLLELLQSWQLDAQISTWPQALHTAGVHVYLLYIDEGFSLPEQKLMFLTGRELLGQRLPQRRQQQRHHKAKADLFGDLQELHIGDAIIHEDHGLGLFKGLITLDNDGEQEDFLHLGYAKDASIYLPVEDLHRLHRYIGKETPTLNTLGSDKWRRKREKVEKDILAMAHELVDLEAQRRQHRTHRLKLTGQAKTDFDAFCARFPFEETDDQLAAIAAIIKDLAQEHCMDRVICGDVGFGKTEIAMRAAFLIANDGRQVAMLAPTTVLATQHYTSISERFANSGMNIALLSRQQSQQESKRIIEQLNKGQIHIIIATHRLLSEQIRFADLGLLIIDEEQRFGVKHKEKLKQLHAQVDLLTLTATPIPRTMHQTLSGLRQVSIIATPPAEREAVRTVVCPYNEELICEAIRRELYRGGQAYYLHNHVASIERTAKHLQELVPEAVIGVAHGQMSPAMLDKRMMDFYEGRLHVLVCTTIIESGLDVANANTLLLERADLLGLSQLHQIRGRVGRSYRQGYAYLFSAEHGLLSKEAEQRLHAIAIHQELGSGFLLARHDMEIRGVGNLLGSEQHGNIESVGLDLYLDMLSDAISDSKGIDKACQHTVDLRMPGSCLLADDYIPQAAERIDLYRRIARSQSDDSIAMLFEEMVDRFGRPPEAAKLLLEQARLRIRAQTMRLQSLHATEQGIRFKFSEHSPIEPMKLINRVQQTPQKFSLQPDQSLNLICDWKQDRECYQIAQQFIDELIQERPKE